MVTVDAEPRPIPDPTPRWCWSQLSSLTEGSLSFAMPRGRVNLPVPYAVVQGQIIIALAPANALGWQAAGDAATLEVSVVEQGRRCLLRADGWAHRSTADAHDANLLASPRDRPRLASDPPPDQLVLTQLRVSGAYETAADVEILRRGPRIAGQLDLAALGRALGAGDLPTLLAYYAADADIRVVGDDSSSAAPLTSRGWRSITSWLTASAGPDLAGEVFHLVDGGDRITLVQRWQRSDGTSTLLTSTAEIENGMITVQHTMRSTSSGVPPVEHGAVG